MSHRPVKSKALDYSSRADAVIVFFAAYTATVTAMLFNAFAGQLAKLSLPLVGLDLHLMHGGSLGPPKYTVQLASRSVQPFLQGLKP